MLGLPASWTAPVACVGICAALWALSCSGPASSADDELWEESCAVPAPTACPDPSPTYEDVEPIFDEYCNSCHDGEDPNGPWPLESYTHIAAWHGEVRDEVLNCTMPPRDGEPLERDGVPLPPDQRQLLMEWIFCGMPK